MKRHLLLVTLSILPLVFISCKNPSNEETQQKTLLEEAIVLENQSWVRPYKAKEKYLDVIKVDPTSEFAEKAQDRIDKINVIISKQTPMQKAYDSMQKAQELKDWVEREIGPPPSK